MNELVIIGTGSQARLAHHYFSNFSDYQVVAFCVHREFIDTEKFCGLDVVPFEEIETLYPSKDYSIFVAVGYSEMNKLRSDLFDKCKEMSYTLPSFISPSCNFLSDEEPGENCFILEDNTIQPFVKIGNNVTIWSGNHIGHDVVIGDHCFITSHVVISGFTIVGKFSFIGVNSTIRDSITIGQRCLIGAGAVIMESTEDDSVWLPPKSSKNHRKSNQIKI